MNIHFESTYPGLLILLSLAIAGTVSLVLYFRNSENQNLSNLQKVLLSILRFVSVFLIVMICLAPFVERTKTTKQVPIIAVAFDNSQSIKTYSTQIDEIRKAADEKFDGKYEVEFWSFGEKVTNDGNVTGEEKRSDYGSTLKTLKNSYINKNIGSILLIGDGIYNQGQNPENVASGMKFPIYTIGIGDTTRRTDALIKNVKTNKVAFLKNKFPVEIELKFVKLKNKIAYLDIENNKKVVYSNTIAIGSDDDFKLEFVNLDALETGMQHYKIKIRPLEGETNLGNNEYDFVIRIQENKQKVLLLSEGPHPDMGALRTSLNELQNYDVRIASGSEIPDSLSTYSLVVLNQLPSQKNTISKLLSELKNNRIPILSVVGPATLLDQLNSLDWGLKIASGNNLEEVQALIDDNFGLFTLTDETKNVLKDMPPLLAPFGNTETSPLIQNLAFQKIKNIPTNKVLMAFGNVNGRKVGFICGEGIWKWRLADFQTNSNHETFNELVQKIVQYMALKQNEDNFNVYHPAVFQETDHVELTGELYNDSYQLINTPDVSIRIFDKNQKEYSYLFDRKDDYYLLNAGTFAPGDYSFEATTKLGNQSFTEKGNFSVVTNEIEIQNTQADFKTLFNISQISGGKFSFYDNYGTLLDSIKTNENIQVQHYKQTEQSELVNVKMIFFLLILLLGAEWFLRKFWGIY